MSIANICQTNGYLLRTSDSDSDQVAHTTTHWWQDLMNRYLEKMGGKFHRRRINESTGHICHSLMIICTQCQITIKPPLQLVSYTPPAHRWNISNEIFMKFYEYQMNRLLSQHCRSLLFNNLEKNIPGMGTISGLHGSETLQIQLQHVPCRSGKRFVPLSSNIAVKSPPK